MLESMIENNTATRAEINDIATAIFQGADTVMLSAEAAVGKFPTQAVSTMTQTILSTENIRENILKILKILSLQTKIRLNLFFSLLKIWLIILMLKL